MLRLRSASAAASPCTRQWSTCPSPCPDHAIVDHYAINPDGPNELVENENYIVFNGKKISKPLAEKPEDGDRHDIWICYYWIS